MRQAQKQFEKLVKAHGQAVEARQSAAVIRASIAGLAGHLSEIETVASDIGTTVIETELALLHVERKALERVHEFAQKDAAVRKGE